MSCLFTKNILCIHICFYFIFTYMDILYFVLIKLRMLKRRFIFFSFFPLPPLAGGADHESLRARRVEGGKRRPLAYHSIYVHLCIYLRK